MENWKLDLKTDLLKEKGQAFLTLSERIAAYWDFYMKTFPWMEPDVPAAAFTGDAAADIRKTSDSFSTLLSLYGTNGVECSFSRKGMRRVKRTFPRRGSYHTHDYIEILYVAKGSFDQILLGEPRHFAAGECVISDCNLEHADVISGEEDSAVLFLWLSPEYLDRLLSAYDSNDLLQQFFFRALKRQKKQQNYLHLTPQTIWKEPTVSDWRFQMERTLESLVWEDYENQAGFESVIYGNLVRLLSLLCAHYSIQLHSSSQDAKEEVLLFELERYIRLHMAEISAEKLEAVFHYHRNYYNLLLQKYRGMSFQNYLISVRMEQAAWLLKNRKLTVKEIARLVGYANTSHFYHLFQAAYGCSPADWREK